ncbi:MAG: uracil-DNA glycosylase [Acidobacteriota bacterium]|nr:uracil-DNA glycosylase [Acidobacteriota bacterium]
MKDKAVLRAQIHDHLRLYSDLGVRWMRIPEPRKKTAVRKTEKSDFVVPQNAKSASESAPPRIVVNESMFDALQPSEESLDAIHADLKDCCRCKLASTRTNLVFGSGNPHAELMFVGEAPGADEDEQGLPFVGRAGQLLTKILESIGMRRDEVYICNILKCRPPGNRNPETDEIAACEQFLFRQITAVKPKVICALGAFGAQTLLRTTQPIGRLRGQLIDYRGAKMMATFHPAYLLRNPNEKRKVWEDMKIIRQYLISLRASGKP